METAEAMRTARRRRLVLILIVGFVGLDIAILAGAWALGAFKQRTLPTAFDGQQALTFVTAQTDLGPRITGTTGGLAAGDYIKGQLEAAGWAAEFQDFEYLDTPARNVIARANVGK